MLKEDFIFRVESGEIDNVTAYRVANGWHVYAYGDSLPSSVRNQVFYSIDLPKHFSSLDDLATWLENIGVRSFSVDNNFMPLPE